MEIVAVPLTASLFAPFGEVLTAPQGVGRTYFDEALSSLRPAARPSISLASNTPLAGDRMYVSQLERHRYSSQSFLHLEGGRWSVLVCPDALNGGPDVARAKAFVAQAWQGITYRSGVWHHALTVLDEPTRHAIIMWRDQTPSDEELRGVAHFTVLIPPRQ
ncbi:ureidoglycolate lyase [Polaromonas sp. CG_23.6]|uniref:ureidoglycolate lyase n=1 Tax=Polaromonas sp. CG_23.6 TaxID=2760709 RepID=UPI002474BC05|nr:ureidoglycolate lyase [Polaromonas sp. CG_23.6]MDH6186723.1 ureidoglycolate lyase [Polaromonas sp. CG_23.6]